MPAPPPPRVRGGNPPPTGSVIFDLTATNATLRPEPAGADVINKALDMPQNNQPPVPLLVHYPQYVDFDQPPYINELIGECWLRNPEGIINLSKMSSLSRTQRVEEALARGRELRDLCAARVQLVSDCNKAILSQPPYVADMLRTGFATRMAAADSHLVELASLGFLLEKGM